LKNTAFEVQNADLEISDAQLEIQNAALEILNGVKISSYINEFSPNPQISSLS